MKPFKIFDLIEVIRNTDHGREWEPATYICAAANMKGWHWVRLDYDSQRVLVPTRRIRNREVPVMGG